MLHHFIAATCHTTTLRLHQPICALTPCCFTAAQHDMFCRFGPTVASTMQRGAKFGKSVQMLSQPLTRLGPLLGSPCPLHHPSHPSPLPARGNSIPEQVQHRICHCQSIHLHGCHSTRLILGVDSPCATAPKPSFCQQQAARSG